MPRTTVYCVRVLLFWHVSWHRMSWLMTVSSCESLNHLSVNLNLATFRCLRFMQNIHSPWISTKLYPPPPSLPYPWWWRNQPHASPLFHRWPCLSGAAPPPRVRAIVRRRMCWWFIIWTFLDYCFNIWRLWCFQDLVREVSTMKCQMLNMLRENIEYMWKLIGPKWILKMYG